MKKKDQERSQAQHSDISLADDSVNISNDHFRVQQRQRQVASLLAQSRTEVEIANQLKVNQSTISRDVQALKEASGQFIQDLARSDLVFSYQQSLRGIDEVKRRLWNTASSTKTKTKDRLMAYRLIMVAEETKFRLLGKGPLLLSYESLAEKVKKFELETTAVESQER